MSENSSLKQCAQTTELFQISVLKLFIFCSFAQFNSIWNCQLISYHSTEGLHDVTVITVRCDDSGPGR